MSDKRGSFDQNENVTNYDDASTLVCARNGMSKNCLLL